MKPKIPLLKPNLKPDWDLNPHYLKLEPLTWCLDLMRFRFFVSVQKEFSERQSERQEIDLLT